MFTYCQTRKINIRFKGDKKYLPKDIIMDEMYSVIGISHRESKKTLVKDDKQREVTNHNFTFFVVNETGKIVSIPDYNCIIIQDDHAAKKA